MPEIKTYYCEKCHKTLKADQFYTSHNLEKYPNEGKFPQCKKCLTMFVDNWKPETYLWILEEADVPYIPDEWNRLMATYCKNPEKVNGTTIVGRYLSKMHLTHFNNYRWKDSEFVQQLKIKKMEETMKKQGYDAQEIALAVEQSNNAAGVDVPPPPQPQESSAGNAQTEDYFGMRQASPEELEKMGLTEADALYLKMKWGKTYKPEEWITLEQFYEDMKASYDIQGAGHEDTLKLICKTSLKCNQLIDIGDVEGFQKMSKVYDQLMKSGKFTAAQNKAENGEFIDSIGELVALCEKQGYIEKYYVDVPKDKVDETLQDMKNYTRSLISNESNLNELIETAIAQNQHEDEVAESLIEEDIVMDDDLTIEDIEKEIKDHDIIDFNEFLDGGSEQDYMGDE